MSEILYDDNGLLKMCKCGQEHSRRQDVIDSQKACDLWKQWTQTGYCYYYRFTTGHCDWMKERNGD